MRHMLESIDGVRLLRNLGIYGIGVACSVAGALGLAGAIPLPLVASLVLFIVGLVVVLMVHEYLEGPF